jgi:hypothetical protein
VGEELFPSGPWVGFYNYRPGDRHRMDLQLEFTNGQMTGEGIDDIGRFVISGRYDVANRECHWTKSYVGAHDVFYHGFREGKGIWGTWEVLLMSGGFHIWPKGESEGDEEAATIEASMPAEAIGVCQAGHGPILNRSACCWVALSPMPTGAGTADESKASPSHHSTVLRTAVSRTHVSSSWT